MMNWEHDLDHRERLWLEHRQQSGSINWAFLGTLILLAGVFAGGVLALVVKVAK